MLQLLTGAEVYAPGPLGRRDLLVGGGRVLALAPRIAPPAGLPVEVVELAGARLCPGLIDGHVHLTGGGGESGPASRVPAPFLTAFATAGTTTVVGVLGTDGTTRSVRDLVARTLALREEGLSAFCFTGSYELPPQTVTGSVRGDLCFVEPVIGVGELAISDHRSSQPTLDELLRIAADCHVGGLMSGKAGILHLHLGDGPRGLELVRRALDGSELPARVFHPTHVNRRRALFAEALELGNRGCTVDVTAFPADGDALSAEEAIVAALAVLPVERITCSSDGAGCLPVFDAQGRLLEMDVARPAALLEALQGLLALGQPLERVLPVFTASPAALLRLRGKGKIEAGADADLLVLDGAGKATHVMARGRFLVRDGRPTALGRFERSVGGGVP